MKRRTMPRTIQCPDCGVVLNVPEAAAGRRLKCPKCATKFTAGGGPVAGRPGSSSGESSGDLGRPSSTLYPVQGPVHGDFDLPTAPGSLREQFDLPLLGEDLPTSRGPAAHAADPIALLKDDPPSSRRRPTGGDARANARRCPTCGSVVPRGMSLCSTCGLDLDTNTRVDLAEEIGTAPPPPRREAPMGVWIVGGISIAASAIFAVISIMQWAQGETGYLFLLLVCGFGVYAAIQFLRLKSIKPLMVALTLGLGVDIVAMVILPVVNAYTYVDIKQATVDPNSTDDADEIITNPAEHLDTNRLAWGIALMISYAAVSLYLNSPPMRRNFRS